MAIPAKVIRAPAPPRLAPIVRLPVPGAVETGKTLDRIHFRAIYKGIALGGLAGMILGLILVAIAIAVADSFAAWTLAAGAGASFLGGAYFGGVAQLLFRCPVDPHSATL
ncbi:MAG: hypothetical protein ACXVPP_01895 [Actinomycetota bacterium]